MMIGIENKQSRAKFVAYHAILCRIRRPSVLHRIPCLSRCCTHDEFALSLRLSAHGKT
jgi:hypothetical protein